MVVNSNDSAMKGALNNERNLLDDELISVKNDAKDYFNTNLNSL